MVFTFSVVVVRGSERGKVPGPWLRLRRDTGSDGDQESSEGQMSDFTNLETKKVYAAKIILKSTLTKNRSR